MNKTLLLILVRAKEVNKWVATKHLLEVPLQCYNSVALRRSRVVISISSSKRRHLHQIDVEKLSPI